jgi:hypothetical protein
MLPADQLLYLSLHAGYSETYFNGLSRICDLAWSMRAFQDAIEWEQLWEKASSWKAERSLYLALRLVQSMLGVTPPGGFLEGVPPAGYDTRMESWAIQQVFEPVQMGGKLAQVWSAQTWLRGGGRIMRNLFPPAWEMRSAYPGLAKGLTWPAAYFKHLVIVLGRNWRKAWNLLIGDVAAVEEARQHRAIEYLVQWQAGNNEIGAEL